MTTILDGPRRHASGAGWADRLNALTNQLELEFLAQNTNAKPRRGEGRAMKPGRGRLQTPEPCELSQLAASRLLALLGVTELGDHGATRCPVRGCSCCAGRQAAQWHPTAFPRRLGVVAVRPIRLQNPRISMDEHEGDEQRRKVVLLRGRFASSSLRVDIRAEERGAPRRVVAQIAPCVSRRKTSSSFICCGETLSMVKPPRTSSSMRKW